MNFPLFVVVLCLSLFCYALLCVHSSFAIILKRKMKLVALLLLSYISIVIINVLWLFLMVSCLACSVSLGYFLIILTFLHISIVNILSNIWNGHSLVSSRMPEV